MKLTLKVNAFIGQNLLGNPAAVFVSEKPMDTEICQLTAVENQLPVTAFICLLENKFFIRWFTPVSELPLCGHGTLAASYVIYQRHLNPTPEIIFYSPQSGELKAKRQENLIFLNFPAKQLTPIACSDNLVKGLAGIEPTEIYDAEDRLLIVLKNGQQVREMKPNIGILKTLTPSGIVITARGETADFVSRTFYPHKPDWEDAVTGASHCALVPYWSKKLKKDNLHALQVSSRGGELFCVNEGNRIGIGGRAGWM